MYTAEQNCGPGRWCVGMMKKSHDLVNPKLLQVESVLLLV